MIEISPEMASLAGFAEHVLEIPMHDWQRDIHFAIEEALLSGHPVQMAIRCPNEAGKTAHIAAPLALSLPMLYPHSLLVYTSAVGRQVDSQFMPAVARHKSRPVFVGWEFKTHTIEAPNGARVEAFTTNDPGRFEGWHNRPPVKLPSGESYMPPLVMVIDEAKTVPDAIYTAVDRCHPDVLILISSADHAKLAGEFYRAFTKHRTLYQCWEIGLNDCPHIPREKIQKIIDKYGETHPFVRASIYGEFPESLDEGIIIPNALIAPCLWRERMAEPPFPRVGMDKVAWCDFAAGGDENVVAMRTGNLVGIEAAWREKDTMAATGEFVRIFRRLGLEPGQIYGDASGLGVGIIDRLKELGWPINRVFNQSAPADPEVYKNLAAEMWDKARRAIERREIIIRDDDTMVQQITTRRWDNDSSGKLKLESKEQMKAMGGDSPDRAESIVGCIAKGGEQAKARSYIKTGHLTFAQWNRSQGSQTETRRRVMRGMSATI